MDVEGLEVFLYKSQIFKAQAEFIIFIVMANLDMDICGICNLISWEMHSNPSMFLHLEDSHD